MTMASTPTFADLFTVSAKYLDYVLEKSLLSHRYLKSISHAGAFVETEIREMFCQLVPNRFRVAHGYIAFAATRSRDVVVSPQVDMMVVDTTVPHTLYVLDPTSRMEVVPVESVVAICELKRRLDRRSLLGTQKLRGALAQLKDITDRTGITKTSAQRYLPGGIKVGGGLGGGYCNNPLVAVIGASHSDSLWKPKSGPTSAGCIDSVMNAAITRDILPKVDMVASLDGFMYALVGDSPPQDFRLFNPWPRDSAPKYGIARTPEKSRLYVLSRIVGYVLGYIQTCTGRYLDVNSYFFNSELDRL
jgi:hypothetical protein